MESKAITVDNSKQGGTDIELAAITPKDIKEYICPEANDKEIMVFVQLCRSLNLNPWRREAYLIKYKGSPAQIVVGKDYFTKCAQQHPRFRGFEAGVILERNGQVVREKGSFLLNTDKLIGGWAVVHVKDNEIPFDHSVAFSEYNQKRALWLTKPATMIRKVALVQTLREVFPEEFGGLYDESEIDVTGETVKPAMPKRKSEMVIEQPEEAEDVPHGTSVPSEGDGEGSSMDSSPDPSPDSEPQKTAGHGDTDTRPVTEPQIKRMFALCHNNGVSNEQLKDYMFRGYDLEHTAEINRDQYNQICAWIESQ